MINYNLAGKALIHCLRVSGASLMLVDEDPDLIARVEEERSTIEHELGMKIAILDHLAKRDVCGMTSERPSDAIREGVKGDWPMTIFYTRCAYSNNASMASTYNRQWNDWYAQRSSIQYGSWLPGSCNGKSEPEALQDARD